MEKAKITETFTPISQVLHKISKSIKTLIINVLSVLLHSFTSFTAQEQKGGILK